jgi:uncharacterized protein YhaN
MKLEKLHLTGFGIFQDAALEGLGPGLNVIEGQNEAGKSTTLEFIRALLFGFQTGHHAQRYEPVRGGAHGGWALARDRQDRLLRLERRAGSSRAGRGEVTCEDPEPVTLEGLLRGADRRLFSSVFAFSLHELRSLETLQGDGIYGRIYAAGSGSGDSSLLTALTDVTRRADELFRPGGRERVLNRLLRSRDTLRAEVERLKGGLDDYNSARTHLDVLRGQVADLRAAETRAREDAGHAQALQNAWPTWIELVDQRHQLAAVPVVEQFPADGPARLDRLNADLAAATEQRDTLRAQVHRIAEQYRAVQAQPRLLEARGRINTLCSGLHAYTAAREDMPVLQSDRERQDMEGRNALAKLGPGWTESRLAELDTSIARQDEVRAHRDRLLAARQAVSAAGERLAAAEQTAARLEALLARAEEGLRSTFPEPPAAGTRFGEECERLEEARGRLEQIVQGDLLRQQVDERLAALREQEERSQASVVNGSTPTLWLPAIPLLLAGVAEWLLRHQPAAAAGAAVVLLAGAALWWRVASREAARLRRSAEARQADAEARASQIAELTERAEKLRQGQAEHRAWLARLSEPPYGWSIREAADVRECLRRLQSTRERRQAYEAQGQIVSARREEWEAARDTHTRAREQRDRLLREVEAEGTNWRAWLRTQGLPESAGPETALTLFAEADRARACFRERDRLQAQLAARQALLREYEQSTGDLLRELGGPSVSVDELVAAVRALPGAVEAAAAAERERAALLQRARELKADWRRVRARLGALLVERESFLRRGGATHDEEFRQRAAAAARRNELGEHIRGLERVLESLSAPGEKRLRLEAELAELDQERLEQLRASARATLAEVVAELEGATREEGKLLERLAALEKDEEITARLRELRAKEAELAETAERWAVLRLTQALLEKTRERFESQRQPGVIRRASQLMAGMTGGRYRAIVAPSGLERVELEAQDYGRKGLGQWSRGTAEQLYLALRFAFIEDYCANPQVEPLPVVMDDVLVHADGYRRLHHAAEAIAALAQRHQVLYFTCRPGDAELLAAVDPAARRFRLEDGVFHALPASRAGAIP